MKQISLTVVMYIADAQINSLNRQYGDCTIYSIVFSTFRNESSGWHCRVIHFVRRCSFSQPANIFAELNCSYIFFVWRQSYFKSKTHSWPERFAHELQMLHALNLNVVKSQNFVFSFCTLFYGKFFCVWVGGVSGLGAIVHYAHWEFVHNWQHTVPCKIASFSGPILRDNLKQIFVVENQKYIRSF